MRRFTPGIARFLSGDTNSWACTRHWTRVHREVYSFYACPLPVHSTELSRRHIPVRLYQIFDRIGATVPGYRAGVSWCNSCSKPADENFKSERDYSPPEKVFHPVFLCHNKETHVHPLKKYLHTFYVKAGSYFSCTYDNCREQVTSHPRHLIPPHHRQNR